MENDNDIRKKEKKIDSNHWMCKIQKFVLGIDATKQYVGYCPFFWMTVLCLFLFPIFCIFRGFMIGCVKVATFMDSILTQPIHTKVVQRKEYKKEELRKIPLAPNDQMLRMMFLNGDDLKEQEYTLENAIAYCDRMADYSWLECQRIALWMEQNPTWKETHYPDAQKRIDIAWEAAKAKNEAEEKRKKEWEATKRRLIMKGAFCGKLLFKVAAVAALGFGAFLIYCGLYKAVTIVQPHVWLEVFSFGCIISAIILFIKIAVCEFIFFIENTESKCLLYTDYKETELRLIFKPFAWTFNAIGWVFNLMVNTGIFFKEAIGILYKEECPLIVWGDETGPIEKRKTK